MNNKKNIFCALLLIFNSCYALPNNERELHITEKKIIQFYKMLYSNKAVKNEEMIMFFGNDIMETEEYIPNSKKKYFENWNNYHQNKSNLMELIRKNKNVFTYGLSLDSVIQKIKLRHYKLDSTYIEDNIRYEIEFKKDKFVYFSFQNDNVYECTIFVNNGQYFDDYVLQDKPQHFYNKKMKIKAKEGYANVRKYPNAKSQIITTLNNNETVFITPDNETFWYRYFKEDVDEKGMVGDFGGYIHKSNFE